MLGCLSLLILISCSQNTSSETKSEAAPAVNSTPAAAAAVPQLKPPYPIEDSSNVQILEGGIKMYVLQKGTGAVPRPKSNVMINYHGMLMNGKVFDSSFDRGTPSDFNLGSLIRGWQIGLTQVGTGSKIKLIIPPEYGYGERGSPPNIPGNATLVFDIELITTY